MKKNAKQQTPVPATLWLESLGDFSEHATQIEAKTIYLSISTQAANPPLVPSAEGRFIILATARTATTILGYEQPVHGMTPLDATVRPDETEAAINAEIEAMTATLEAAGLQTKKGKWTL